MGIGKEIARIRKLRGLTQKELATRVSIKANFLSEIESEKKTASLDTIIRLAANLRCSLDELVGNEMSEAAALTETERAVQNCREDALIRKSVIMMGDLPENKKFKIFTYVQDQMTLSKMREPEEA